MRARTKRQKLRLKKEIKNNIIAIIIILALITLFKGFLKLIEIDNNNRYNDKVVECGGADNVGYWTSKENDIFFYCKVEK